MSLLKKPEAVITLDVKGEPFYPGSTLDLLISISSQEKFMVRKGIAELTCWEKCKPSAYGSWKARNNLFVTKEEFLGRTEFMPGMEVSDKLTLKLPSDLPPTAHGDYVNISYKIVVKLDVEKMRDIHEGREIMVLPVFTTEKSDGSIRNNSKASSGDADLILTLNKDHALAGEMLEGILEVEIKKVMGVRDVRVELEVEEMAGAQRSKTIKETVMLEENASLYPGTLKKWPFSMRVPNSRLPSLYVSMSSVEWRVKGIIGKDSMGELSVSCPIRVF